MSEKKEYKQGIVEFHSLSSLQILDRIQKRDLTDVCLPEIFAINRLAQVWTNIIFKMLD